MEFSLPSRRFLIIGLFGLLVGSLGLGSAISAAAEEAPAEELPTVAEETLPAPEEPTSDPVLIADTDEDGIADEDDNCVEEKNADQADTDADGVGDVCDSVEPTSSNEPLPQNGLDGDDSKDDKKTDTVGEFPAPEGDADSDGVADEDDNCALIANPEQEDSNGDDIGDACDAGGIGSAPEEKLPTQKSFASFGFFPLPTITFCELEEEGVYSTKSEIKAITLLHVIFHHDDIIPPFSYGLFNRQYFPGQNWDAEGQAIYNNGCEKLPSVPFTGAFLDLVQFYVDPTPDMSSVILGEADERHLDLDGGALTARFSTDEEQWEYPVEEIPEGTDLIVISPSALVEIPGSVQFGYGAPVDENADGIADNTVGEAALLDHVMVDSPYWNTEDETKPDYDRASHLFFYDLDADENYDAEGYELFISLDDNQGDFEVDAIQGPVRHVQEARLPFFGAFLELVQFSADPTPDDTSVFIGTPDEGHIDLDGGAMTGRFATEGQSWDYPVDEIPEGTDLIVISPSAIGEIPTSLRFGYGTPADTDADGIADNTLGEAALLDHVMVESPYWNVIDETEPDYDRPAHILFYDLDADENYDGDGYELFISVDDPGDFEIDAIHGPVRLVNENGEGEEEESAVLTLIKIVVNDDGGVSSATDWTLTASGAQQIAGATGSEKVTSASVVAGSYDLSEAGPAGYTASGWTCVGGGIMVDADTVMLAAEENVTCTITNNDVAGENGGDGGNGEEESQEEEGDGNGGNGGNGGSGGSSSARRSNTRSLQEVGEVLGASTETAACPFLTQYLRIDQANNPTEVNKAKVFFNVFLGRDLQLNGVFDEDMRSAVIEFQKMFAGEVLDTWQPALGQRVEPTGYIYKTTRWKINDLVCPGYEAFPVLP